MSYALIKGLESRSIKVTSVLNENKTGLTDKEQLIYASNNGFTLYSYNVKDFAKLHFEFIKKGMNHNGIILINRNKYSIGEQIKKMSNLIQSCNKIDLINDIEFLSNW